MKLIVILLGGVLGLMVVRAYVLEPGEVEEWQRFWLAVEEHQAVEAEGFFASSTTLKCAAGFFAGGLAGALLAGGRRRRPADPEQQA